MAWDPAQYLKFADHRLRPAIDLLNRIDADAPREVYDLGAGTGNVTRLLQARWPNAHVTGVDGSAEMLAKAGADGSRIDWVQADLGAWQPTWPADVIYSNAALHWIPDHVRLFPELLARLVPGGTLAVQMPRNFAAPSHTLIADAALTGPWRKTLEPLLRPGPTGEPAFY
ncbi:MAG: trans-aconitate 2-methyltransferase, partial [Chloroflexota bacterium]|nr:trans-aconitate 2-methyltransferase [Chloroflexota bacterium]